MSRRPRVTTPVSRRRSRRTTCSGCSTAATSAIPRVSATTRSSCWSHAWACDRSRRRGCRLDDLDWRAGRIVLRGKASREDGMPLPADVGEALSAYLRQARPATGEPPGVSAAVPVRPSPVATDPRRHRTPRFPPWPGRETSTCLSATDGTIVIRPNRAKLGPSSAEELDFG